MKPSQCILRKVYSLGPFTLRLFLDAPRLSLKHMPYQNRREAAKVDILV